MRRLAVILVLCVLPACAPKSPPRAAATRPDLGSELDCLREHNLAVVAAHRGQPDQTAAENAFSSFRASLAAGVPFLEIDVATTKDGVMCLMHDDSLDRTTTGTGAVIDRTWAEVESVKLRKPDGTVLDEHVPRFADVLSWGRTAGARFEIDVKKTTKFGDVVKAVQDAGMTDRGLVVTYSLADAKAVHALDARLMISVTMETPEDVEAARAALPAARTLAWTGTSNPQSRPFAQVRAAGIEPIFGTLGRPGDRLDDRYLADGNPSEYLDLVKAGVVMIASDSAVIAQKAIGMGYKACMAK
jgi:glycerophosphoryl diester phosphodiesterase